MDSPRTQESYLPLPNWVRFSPTQMEPGPEGCEGRPREANQPSTRRTRCQGRPEVAGMPLRRIYIPKEDGRQRPISIPALEDKIAQKAVVELLNAIYEQDFLDCSYGFRPGRGAQQALDEAGRVICARPTGWILEIDITAYFDSIVREQLMEMIEKRIGDASILRLIRKWINIGVIDAGRLLVSETGTGQGQI